MKVSFNWLKDYIDIKIPLPKLADILTMRSFEVAAVEKVGSDYVMDIEVLPNRAHDCLSHIGVAREISALLETKLKIKETKVKEDKKSSVKNYLAIKIEEPELCRRYVGRVILGVKVGPSPKWLKDRLEAIGQKSINNIVDAANYAMFEYGQPLHAFDLDKVESVKFPISKSQFPKKITVRKARKEEKIVTLDGETYILDENMLVIADGPPAGGEPLAIAGIKGGRKAEIDKNTKNIILESANFEPANIRRTSRALGLRTESSLRFEHEISSRLAEVAVERLAELIAAVAGGKIAKGKIDEYVKKPIPYFIAIRPGEVERILGAEIPEKEIVEIFKRLGFEAKKISPLEIILKTAKGLLGKPYKYGASVSFDAPNLFDCSSFVSFCFSRAGIQLHRLSVEQFIYDGVAADKTELLPGDLVFSKGKKPYFYKETPKGVGHVGIYLGNGKVVHASSSRGVVIEPLAKSLAFKEWRGAKRILTERNDLLLTKIPPERLDLRIKEDLIEEIARIHGYENIPSKLPLASLAVPKRNDLLFWERMAKDALSGAGFDEIYNYSFVGEKDIENAGFNPAKIAFLLNPVSDEKKFLRPALLINLIKNVGNNFRFFDEARMFEIGKIFRKNAEIGEKRMLAGVIAHKTTNRKGREFYELKGVIDALFDGLGIAEHWYAESPEYVRGNDFEPRSGEAPRGFWKEGGSAEIKVGDKHVGYLGEITPLVLEKYDIKTPVAGFEIDFEALASLAEEEQVYYPISKYPAIVRDLAILLPLEIRVEEALNVIENVGGPLLQDADLFDMYEGENLPGGMKSLAFRLIFQSKERTLSDKEVGDITAKIINAIRQEGWEVR